MQSNFDLVTGGGFAPPLSIAGGSPLETPWYSMKGQPYVDLIISLATGAPEPVLLLEQATDNAGTSAAAFPISSVKVAAAADLNVEQPWVKDPAVDRETPADVAGYTPAGDLVTTGNTAMVHIRVEADNLDGANTHFRLASPAIAGRAAVVAVVAPCKWYRGDADVYSMA